MAAWQFAQALFLAGEHGWHRFASMQDHYNLVYREEEREMIPLCLYQGVAVIPWSPLARGFLTGSRSREEPHPTQRSRSDEFADQMYFTEADYGVLDALLEVSRERGAKPATVALAWLLSVPGVTAPIIGSTREEHLLEAAAAVELKLTSEEIVRLEARYVPHRILGHTQPGPRG